MFTLSQTENTIASSQNSYSGRLQSLGQLMRRVTIICFTSCNKWKLLHDVQLFLKAQTDVCVNVNTQLWCCKGVVKLNEYCFFSLGYHFPLLTCFATPLQHQSYLSTPAAPAVHVTKPGWVNIDGSKNRTSQFFKKIPRACHSLLVPTTNVRKVLREWTK